MSDWIAAARSLGFFAAVPLIPKALRALEEVRAMCAADRCHAYGKNWTCPPECGTLAQCAAELARFQNGILVQSMGTLEDSFDYEGMMALEAQHLTRFYTLCGQLRECFPDALCLGTGGCRICGSCAYPAPCRFPEKACASMEAYGLLVSEVCSQCGVAYYYGPNTLTYTACILFSKEC